MRPVASALTLSVRPWRELLPAPAVHADLTTLAALAATYGTAPVTRSRSPSASASASLIRSPARHRITISARTRSAFGDFPAQRITATISSTVGGSAG
jgi:hypothetical protein